MNTVEGIKKINSTIGVGNTAFIVNKYGKNADIDTATTPESIYPLGGLYPFPSSAVALEIVSSSTADVMTSGTGAWTVEIEGRDANWNFQTEIVELNGTTAVNLASTYLRVFRAKVVQVGTGLVNAGNITVRTQGGAGTDYLYINLGEGQTLMAVYSTGANETFKLTRVWGTLNRPNPTNANAEMNLYTRTDGESWRVKLTFGLSSNGTTALSYEYYGGLTIPPKTDIDLRCVSVSANDTNISGGFDLVGIS